MRHKFFPYLSKTETHRRKAIITLSPELNQEILNFLMDDERFRWKIHDAAMCELRPDDEGEFEFTLESEVTAEFVAGEPDSVVYRRENGVPLV